MQTSLPRVSMTALKNKGAKAAERAVQAAAKPIRAGETHSADRFGGEGAEVVFTVGKTYGAGFFGTVCAASLSAAAEGVRAALPQLFNADGSPRAGLVIKLPHTLPVPAKMDAWAKALRAEARDAERVEKALDGQAIAGAKVLFACLGAKPFLVKEAISAQGISGLRATQTELTTEQVTALERDIFAKAMKIDGALARGLDIKPQNLVWDADQKVWGMYEVTLLPAKLRRFFTKGGFDAYVAYVNEAMRLAQ